MRSTMAQVSANPPKRDRWQPYRDTRFVLVRAPGRQKPCRGLVLEWRRIHPRRWEAYVVYYDDASLDPAVRIAWLNPAQLIPVPVDPNWLGPG